MLVAKWLKEAIGPHFNAYLLVAVGVILAGGVVVSMVKARREGEAAG
jgi:hypothetical protein